MSQRLQRVIGSEVMGRSLGEHASANRPVQTRSGWRRTTYGPETCEARPWAGPSAHPWESLADRREASGVLLVRGTCVASVHRFGLN